MERGAVATTNGIQEAGLISMYVLQYPFIDVNVLYKCTAALFLQSFVKLCICVAYGVQFNGSLLSCWFG